MAQFKVKLPDDIMKDIEDLDNNSSSMFGEMCDAAADAVVKNVKKNMKSVFKSTDSLERGLKKTKVFKTPSDDSINVKVMFVGYDNKPTPQYPQGTPITIKAMAREFGTSRGEGKKPFFRKSFKKNEIEAEMLKIQNKYLPEE